MSYTKQTWQTGDTITAEKLNHLEDGVDDVSRTFMSQFATNLTLLKGDQ